MKTMFICIALTFCVACEAVDNFDTFRVIPGEGSDASSDLKRGVTALDLGTMDLVMVDGARSDLTTGRDAEAPPDLTGDSSAPPDLMSDFSAPPDLTQTPDLAKPCGMTLANSGGGAFTIRFRITTMAMAPISTVLFQRVQCNNANQDFWDIQLGASGHFGIETGNGPGNYSQFATMIAVNDGKPHDVVITRSNGIISTTTDGVFSGSGAATAVYAALTPLGIGMGDPCEGVNGMVALVGTVTNVCLQVGP